MLLSLLSFYGRQAFAFSSYTFIQEDSGDRLYSQTYQNTEGLIFQQIFFGSASEYTENFIEYIFGTAALAVTGNLQFRNAQGLNISTDYLQDHRNDLKQKIFPFHFFW